MQPSLLYLPQLPRAVTLCEKVQESNICADNKGWTLSGSGSVGGLGADSRPRHLRTTSRGTTSLNASVFSWPNTRSADYSHMLIILFYYSCEQSCKPWKRLWAERSRDSAAVPLCASMLKLFWKVLMVRKKMCSFYAEAAPDFSLTTNINHSTLSFFRLQKNLFSHRHEVGPRKKDMFIITTIPHSRCELFCKKWNTSTNKQHLFYIQIYILLLYMW